MSGIAVERDEVFALLGKFEQRFEGVQEALSGRPGAADAGEASNEIGLIVTAVEELAEKSVITGTGFTAVSRRAVDGLLADDAEAAEVFTRIGKTEQL